MRQRLARIASQTAQHYNCVYIDRSNFFLDVIELETRVVGDDLIPQIVPADTRIREINWKNPRTSFSRGLLSRGSKKRMSRTDSR